jgi:MFS family permease
LRCESWSPTARDYADKINLSTLASSITVPAGPLIQQAFSVSREAAVLPLTLYTLGLAIGPLFIAPLSETLGRRPIYIGTLTTFLAFIAGSGAANNFVTLLVCRFLAGFAGSAGLAMGAGTVADVWALEKSGGSAALFFILGPFLGPTLGPLAGAYIVYDYGGRWRWTQWVILIVGAPIWIGMILMKETSKAQILKGVRKAGPWSMAHVTARIKHHVWGGLVRPVRMLFTEAIVFFLSLYTAYAYAMVFSFFDSYPYILTVDYGFNSRQVGLSFISVIIGYLLATFLFGVFEKTLYAKARSAANGLPAPEHRLYSALVGSFFLPIGLFW